MTSEPSSSESEAPLLVEVKGAIATVTLNRPRRLNALDRELRGKLITVFGELAQDAAVRVIVLRGVGRAFCAGQDQNESAAINAAASQQRIAQYGELFLAMRACGKPIIAQVHGFAVGAGLQLALLADLNVVARSSQLGLPEFERGAPCITGSTLAWAIVGPSATKRLVLTAERISADEALRIGLIQQVAEDDALQGEVEKLAQRVARWPVEALRQTMMWWDEMSGALLKAGIDRACKAHAANFETGVYTEHAKEFLSVRKSRADE